MAARNDLDDDEAPARREPEKQSVMKLIIPGTIAVFLGALGAQVTAPLINGLISGAPHAAVSADAAAGADAQGQPDPRSLEPPIYTPLDPPLVVSFADSAGRTRFMQLSLQTMSRSEKETDAVKRHAPALRNAFLFLISKRSVEELSTPEGKEKLRADMLAEAQSIMRANTGKDSIEELYFTSLVIQ